MTIDPRRYVRRWLNLIRAERELEACLVRYQHVTETFPTLRDDLSRLYPPSITSGRAAAPR